MKNMMCMQHAMKEKNIATAHLCLFVCVFSPCFSWIVLFCSCATQPRQHKIRCCLGLISVQYGVTPWFAEMRVHIFCISPLKLM